MCVIILNMTKIKKNLPRESAGRIMIKNVPLISPKNTIKSVEENLLRNVRRIKSINYLYVLDKDKKLKGVISIKELFRQPKNKQVSSVMKKKIIFASPQTDREEVAYLALKNNIKAIPLVDHNNIFLGAVLSDDILRIVYKELQEDISRFAGVEKFSANIDDINSLSLLSSLKHRLPWLFAGMGGGIIAAQVISIFEATLAENIILASFIPLVVYIASAVGTQAGYFVVRDLAINKKINFFLYFLRQVKVIFSMGVVISLSIFLLSLIFYSYISIALVLGLAVFLTILSSVLTGLFIPYLFSRLKFDPANASGPIATIVQDLISVTIYLSVAQILL